MKQANHDLRGWIEIWRRRDVTWPLVNREEIDQADYEMLIGGWPYDEFGSPWHVFEYMVTSGREVRRHDVLLVCSKRFRWRKAYILVNADEESAFGYDEAMPPVQVRGADLKLMQVQKSKIFKSALRKSQ